MSERSVRFFNTTGPCNPEDYYMLPPEDRLVGAQLHRYIRDKLYWVLHAPRQTGKTTFLQSWMKEINTSTEAVACYVSVERCQGFNEVAQSMPALYSAICKHAKEYALPIPQVQVNDYTSLLNDTLEAVQAEGLEQTRAYRDKTGPSSPSYLVIFDRRPDARCRPWSERLQWKETGGVTVIGC